MKIKTDESQPMNEKEVSKAQVSPKGAGADRQPDPKMTVDGLAYGKYSPRKGSPRS
jgi:hypothetical protein